MTKLLRPAHAVKGSSGGPNSVGFAGLARRQKHAILLTRTVLIWYNGDRWMQGQVVSCPATTK